MAEDSGNEDSWLYGDSALDHSGNNEENEKSVQESFIADTSTQEVIAPSEDSVTEQPAPISPPAVVDAALKEGSKQTEDTNGLDPEGEDGDETKDGEPKEGKEPAEDGDEDDDDDSDDDDDIQVTIGDIKTAPTYTSINLKRGLAADKNKQPGKFSIEEFEAVGTINGVAAHDFNVDNLEDKPWRKPGADITDYFNYGFNEDTWRAYCERQKRIRIHDSGVGLMSLGGTGGKVIAGSIPVTIVNDNSKYSGIAGPKKAGPPPGRKFAGTIDVIGGNPISSRRSGENKTTPEPQENPIQVMTANRRDYPKPRFPDLSVPPPLPQFDMPPPGMEAIPPYTGAGYNNSTEFYPPDADPYYQSYEPTQDSQWGQQPWEGGGGGGAVSTVTNVVIPLGGEPPRKNRDDSRDGRKSREGRESSVSDVKEEAATSDKERHREGRHRHRSRSTERRSGKKRNKSRSRSPHRHRSKKKSRRERDDSD